MLNNQPSVLKTIFFDLGSTLIYSKDPWRPIFKDADAAMVKALQQAGIPVEIKSFSNKYGTFLDSYNAKQGTSTLEKTTFSILSELLEQNGFPDVSAPIVRSALDAVYSITQQNWYLEADAIPILIMLKKQGYHLGIISNTSDDRNVQQLVDKNRLRPYFDLILTSAGCGIRKPDERIFHLALDYFKIPPEKAAMVGDTLEADILGANRLGIYSIWITRRSKIVGEGELSIQPQAVVTKLDDLPGLLGDIENGIS